MSYTGQVKEGVVVFDGTSRPVDGTRVQIDEVPFAKPEAPTWGEVLKEFRGAIDGLPDDLAGNHDHYIHGSPKR